MPATLPIDEALPRLRTALSESAVVILSAPPGAGKTTRVPLSLLRESWLGEKTITMLEPRRLAARRAAAYMSATLGEKTGTTVGYRIRGESRTSTATRIEVVTEGILTRLLHADPGLTGTGLIIFDEFHERSVHADLGLALALDVQRHLRDDLRLLIMSATLDGVALRTLLGDVPVVESAGRTYPVETRYRSAPVERPIEIETADTVRRACERDGGDVLVFLPGRREIRRTASILRDARMPDEWMVCPLTGDASPADQTRALAPAPGECRKIILATSVAETSLTIDGVRVVIDSGLARLPDFDPRRGMPGLITAPVSRATADQRRGRAGRQSPGVCYRLWTEKQHATLPPFPPPEILVTDLTPLALDLAAWGDPWGNELRFIDPPPLPHLTAARGLLRRLGAVEESGAITPHGRAMAGIPVHPRLAHMIVRGGALGAGREACELAALLGEDDPLDRGDRADIDVAARWQSVFGEGEREGTVVDRVVREARRLQTISSLTGRQDRRLAPGTLLGFAWPDRIAQHRGGGSGRYQTAAGTGVVLPAGSPLAREEYLAVVEVDGTATEARVFVAAPLPRNDLLRYFTDQVTASTEVDWDEREEGVIARSAERLGSLVIASRPLPPDDARIPGAMLEGVRRLGLEALPWSKEARELIARSEWLRRSGAAPAGWPELSNDRLTATLDSWLTPFLSGMTKRSHLARLDTGTIVRSLLPARGRSDLDRLAPARWKTPAGSDIPLQYTPGEPPVLAVKLQEMFGQLSTPTVGASTPVRVHLLSPAGRPLAMTQDLRTFWRDVYPEVRKEMRGRYPKHIWPEDPVSAHPTKRTTKRRSR